MRALLLAAVLFMAILAGCAGKKADSSADSFTCPDGTKLDLTTIAGHDNATFNATAHCPKKTNSTGNATSNTTKAPNKLPILKFKSSNETGNVTNVTNLKGNLFFDASGSMDLDGNITGLAMTATDSNTTHTATLYDPATKTFKVANIKIGRAGTVNVSVAVVDDQGGFTTFATKVYVDFPQDLSGTIAIPDGDQAGGACKGPDE